MLENNDTSTILIVDDESISSNAFFRIVKGVNKNFDVKIASTIDECLSLLRRHRIDVLILDKNLQDISNKTVNSIKSIPAILNQSPNIQILMVTGALDDTQHVVESIKLGAFGFVEKTDPSEILAVQIEKAVEVSKRLLKGILPKTSKLKPIGAESPKMKTVLLEAQRFSQGKAPVLILGESGSGKTLLAEHIHSQFSGRGNRPFVSINLSALPASIVERELFGNEKGAFTDSKTQKLGFFELANGGTLFLDEIGDISLELQIKLIKVIEERTFYRLGGDRPIVSDFKLICATHRNLESLVRDGLFREDLFMRISALQISIPSLSERQEDIVPIIKAALPFWAEKAEVQATFGDLPDEFVEHLCKFPGRGNIRGIEQQILRVFTLANRLIGGKISLENWRESLNYSFSPLNSRQPTDLIDKLMELKRGKLFEIKSLMADVEYFIYSEAVKQGRSQVEIANLLKTSQATVSSRLNQYRLI